MPQIHTVTGEIAPEKLGYCQAHEHILIAKGKSFELNPALCIDDEAASLKELMLYKEAGGCSLVDAQPTGAGGMPRELRRISQESGIRIIASTGFHKLIFYPEGHWVFSKDENALKLCFTSDLVKGLSVDADMEFPQERCEAKAGVVKCALDSHGLDDDYKRLFKAASLAARETGAPMLIHTEDGAHALELIEYIASFGVETNRIILCHTERSMQRLEEKLKIASTGVFLECDTIARFKYHSDEDEVVFLKRLCEAGHEDRILLGLDTTRQRLKSYGGETGLDYILKTFIPMMPVNGLGAKLAEKFCVSNPAAAFTWTTV